MVLPPDAQKPQLPLKLSVQLSLPLPVRVRIKTTRAHDEAGTVPWCSAQPTCLPCAVNPWGNSMGRRVGVSITCWGEECAATVHV